MTNSVDSTLIARPQPEIISGDVYLPFLPSIFPFPFFSLFPPLPPPVAKCPSNPAKEDWGSLLASLSGGGRTTFAARHITWALSNQKLCFLLFTKVDKLIQLGQMLEKYKVKLLTVLRCCEFTNYVFLYLQPRERVWWLRISSYFC